MPAAFTTLQLSDGTTTCNLVDLSNYMLINGGWAPQDTYRLDGELWRRGPYANVTEEITIDIFGADTATLLANRDRLARLLDQAARWARGQGVSAVLISCLPQGSNGTALSAVVFGRRGAPAVGNPQSWNDLLMVSELPEVPLTFERAGPWLAASDTATATAAANPSIRTATFGSTHPTLSPLRIDVTGYSSSAAFTGEGFLIIADAANKLALLNVEAATSEDATSVADAANFAVSNVLRLNGDSGVLGAAGAFPSMPSAIRTISFYASVRNNSTTAPARLGVVAQDVSGPITGTYTLWRTIPPNTGVSAGPRVFHLGTLRLNAQLASFYFTRGDLSGATVDIDTVVMLGRDGTDDEACRAVPFGMAFPSTAASWKHVFDPRALTSPTPFVGSEMTSGGARTSGPWGGDPYLLTVGDTVSAVIFQTMPFHGYWRHVTSGSATSLGFTATRNKAYLTPQ